MASVWSFSPADTQLYSRMFAAADSAGRGRVNFVQSQLQRSGLPVGTLQQIWQLADTDSDTMLTRPEYFAACHMIMRNLKLKTPLPAALPVELSVAAAGASGAPLPTAPGGDAMASMFGAPQASVPGGDAMAREKAARVSADKAAAEQAAEAAQAQAAARAAEQAVTAEAARLAAERAAADRAAAERAAAERAAAERAAVEQAAAQKAAASLAQLPADPFGRPVEPFGGGAGYLMDSPHPNTPSHFGQNALGGVLGATAQGRAPSAGSYAPASAPVALGGGGGSLSRHSLLAGLARAWQIAAPGPSGSSAVSSPVSSLANWAAGPDLDPAAVARLGRAAAEVLGHGSGPSVQAGGPQADSGTTDAAQRGSRMGGPNAGGEFGAHAGTGHAPPVAAQAPAHDSFSSFSASMGAALPAASPWAQPYGGSGMGGGMDSGMGGGMCGGMGVDGGGGGMVGGGGPQQDPFSGLGMSLGGSSATGSYAMGNGHQDARGVGGGMGDGVGPGDAHSAPSPMINPSAFSMAAPAFGAPAAAPAVSPGAHGTDHFGGGMVDFGGGVPSPAALGFGVASGGMGPSAGEAFGPATADFGGSYAHQQPSSPQQPPAVDGFGYAHPQPAAQAAASFGGSSGFGDGDYGNGGFSGEPSCCAGGGAAFGGGASAAGPSDYGAGYGAPVPAYGATAFGGGGGDGFGGSLAGDGFGYLAGGGSPSSSQFGASPSFESHFGTSQQQQQKQQGVSLGGAAPTSDFGAMGFGGAPASQANDGFGFGAPTQGFGSAAPAAQPVDAGGFGAGFDASFGIAAAQPPAADFGSLGSSFGQGPPPAATSHGGGTPGFVSTFDDDFSGVQPPAPAPAPAPPPPPPRAPVESGIAPMTSAELAQYRLLFDSVGGGAPVTRAQADSVFARAQLPSDEVDLIWVINDLDMDGMLLADEFAVALHIAAARYKGARLPEERPEGLLPTAEARASGSYRVGGYDHGGGAGGNGAFHGGGGGGGGGGYDHGGGNGAFHSGRGGGGEAGESASASAKSRWRVGGSAAKISTGRRDGPSAPAPVQDYGGGYGGGGGGGGGGAGGGGDGGGGGGSGGGGGGSALRFGSLTHNKKLRWCTLSGGCFSVYKAQHDKAPQTQLSLRTDVQRVWQSNMATFSLVLEPNRAGAKPRKGPAAPPEKLEFTADSPMELTAWVEALQRAIATSKS